MSGMSKHIFPLTLIILVLFQVGRESTIVQHIQKDTRRGIAPPGIEGAFPSMLPSGLYIRSRTMSQANYTAASYFHTIDGFLYPQRPTITYPRNAIVPVASTDLHLLMPVHHCVVGLSGLAGLNRETLYRPADAFPADTWVIPSRGLYKDNVGLILGDEYEVGIDIQWNSECLVGFLPRVAIPDLQCKLKTKRVKLAHPAPAPTLSRSFAEPAVGEGPTLMSRWKSAGDYVSVNTAASFPIPIEPVNLTTKAISSNKRKFEHPCFRNHKIYQGHNAFPSYAKAHSLRISKLCCYECSSPETCDHIAKHYSIKGQKISPHSFC